MKQKRKNAGIFIRDSEKGHQLLHQIANHYGLTASEVVRGWIRDEAQGLGLLDGGNGGGQEVEEAHNVAA